MELSCANLQDSYCPYSSARKFLELFPDSISRLLGFLNFVELFGLTFNKVDVGPSLIVFSSREFGIQDLKFDTQKLSVRV